ncbi:hypothetical protein [Streptomyces sp. NPDC059787]|uniref:hypothetical protein n=1 Tax=Streptomyces sp. NPDC059787 TaxID=3346947 RepID=UPI00364C4842
MLVGSVSLVAPETPSVGVNDFTGGCAAAEHLVRLGHRRIGVISGPGPRAGARTQVAGYRSAMDSAGLAHDVRLEQVGGLRHADGVRATEQSWAFGEPSTAGSAGTDQ